MIPAICVFLQKLLLCANWNNLCSQSFCNQSVFFMARPINNGCMLFFIAPSCKLKIPHVVMTALQEIKNSEFTWFFYVKKLELRQHTASLKHYWVVEKKLKDRFCFSVRASECALILKRSRFVAFIYILETFATDPTIMLEGCWKSLISVLLKSKRMHKGNIRIQREEYCTLTQS